MNRPKKEDYYIETEYGIQFSPYDYIKAIDDYCDFLEKQREIHAPFDGFMKKALKVDPKS